MTKITLNTGILHSQGYKDATAKGENITLRGNLTVTEGKVSVFTGALHVTTTQEAVGSFEYRKDSDPMMPMGNIMRVEVNNPDYFAYQTEASEVLTAAINQIETTNTEN